MAFQLYQKLGGKGEQGPMAWHTYNVITSKQTKQAMHVFMAGSNFKLSSLDLELFI
jgi:hypothetical protein